MAFRIGKIRVGRRKKSSKAAKRAPIRASIVAEARRRGRGASKVDLVDKIVADRRGGFRGLPGSFVQESVNRASANRAAKKSKRRRR